jgi:penicillin-binding protein 1C
MQERVTEIINRNQELLAGNHINNSACLVTTVSTGEVLAYVGNSTLASSPGHGGNVDLIRAERSTGSILKPILYAAMQGSGQMLPDAIVPDVPVRFQGFSPENFNKSFSGAVPASSALSQSLNIPAVNMLRSYTPAKFLSLLRQVGFTSFRKNEDYYGLSLILGGGETSLWELAGVYGSMARVLERYNETGKYSKADYMMPLLTECVNVHANDTAVSAPLSAASVWLTFTALEKVNRPDIEAGWQYFSSSGSLAWKTGTSYGFRDAWAVGTTPDRVIAVWAGNADGEGRPGLSGHSSAAPVLFDVYALLKNDKTFAMPKTAMTVVKVCSKSGMRAGPDCPETEEKWVDAAGLKSDMCKYHKILNLDPTGSYRVNSNCADPSEIRNESWFVLSPAMEYYFRRSNSWYRSIPPVRPGCIDDESVEPMEFIYPVPGGKIFFPRDETGNRTAVVAEIAHRDPSLKIYWSLDRDYLTSTRHIHRIVFNTTPGRHVLSATDENGSLIRCPFTVSGSSGNPAGN